MGGRASATDQRTVGSAMVRRPVVHPPGLTVGEARGELLDPHRHLLLLVLGERLVGTLARDDLLDAVDGAAPALAWSTLTGRTTSSGAGLAGTAARMRATSARRLAVVTRDHRLLGLLCLKGSGAGFCSDEGIAARAAAGLG